MQLGLSAQAIAGSGRDHPWDPSDLLRCINYCRSRGFSTDDLRARMTGRSASWNLLLPEWDNLKVLLENEMYTRTDGNAPRTYREMKRVLADGIACPTCDSTGRGTECAGCKGTGRRCGGKCRAKHCFFGADLCVPCNGRGYTTTKKAN